MSIVILNNQNGRFCYDLATLQSVATLPSVRLSIFPSAHGNPKEAVSRHQTQTSCFEQILVG